MTIQFDNKVFDSMEGDKQTVFQIFPNVYADNRGSFTEVLKDTACWPCNDLPIWMTNLQWVRQVNRSISAPGTIRGCHAQRGLFCQGKLVEALTEKIYDIITDARPDSKTFGVSSAYLLDPLTQNKLWVPRGFLHSFVVPVTAKSPAIFQYFCDNTYNKNSELGVNPMSLLPKVVESLKTMSKDVDRVFADRFSDLFKTFETTEFQLSEKDLKNESYQDFMKKIKAEFDNSNSAWYR